MEAWGANSRKDCRQPHSKKLSGWVKSPVMALKCDVYPEVEVREDPAKASTL